MKSTIENNKSKKGTLSSNEKQQSNEVFITEDLYIRNELHVLITHTIVSFCVALIIFYFIWANIPYEMPLLLLILMIIFFLFPILFSIWEWIDYWRYPYLFKANAQGLYTYFLTGSELCIPWEVISKLKTYKLIHHAIRYKKRVIGPMKKVYHNIYISTVEIVIWDRDFLATLEGQSTRLLKQSISCHPVWDNDPMRWTVQIPCVLRFVHKDLQPVIESMNQFCPKKPKQKKQ